MTLTIADVLERAADLIGRNGWTQDAFGEPGGCHCVRGAIAEIAGIDPRESRHDAETVLAEHILGHPIPRLSCAGSVLVRWNDTPGRTQSEVVAKLREAAAKAREEGK